MSKKEHKNEDMEKDLHGTRQEQEQAGSEEATADKAGEENQNEPDRIEALNQEIQKEKDNFLRLFAEFENYKKRTSRERIELFSTASRELMTALLPVLDDFERGLNEIEKSSDGALLEGMKLIYNKFRSTLIQKGLKEVEVKAGDSFDPEIHEAISQVPAPDKKLKGKIIDVVEKGYKLGDSVIRYPKVVMGS
jgi:molecular chaperone GrpE